MDESYAREILRIASILDVEGGQLIHEGAMRPGLGFWLSSCAETALLDDHDYLFVFLYQAASSMFYDLDSAPQIDVNARDYESNSALDYACIWGDLRAVRLLVSAGADINALGDMDVTPLHRAASGNFPEIVEFLLQNGAKQAKNAFGLTPLECAIQKDNPDILRLLEKR